MQITVKLFFQDEIRRVSIGDENGELTISHLKSTVDAIFPALKHGDFRLLWKDEDGDFITISSNSEFLDAVKEMTADGLAKFHIKTAQETTDKLPSSNSTHSPQMEDHRSTAASEREPVHDGVQCDECGVLPIVGARFKCSVRNDFDLCAACEAKGPQPHPMIKINSPKRSFSPFRGFPGFGGRAGRGGGRFGGRCGAGGRLGGWFGGEASTEQLPNPPLERGPPFGPFGPGFIPQGPPPTQHAPFGGRGRGCEWREALRRRMQRDHQPAASQDSVPSAASSTVAATSEGPAVHLGVGCDGCRMVPIVGPRYKCAVREDYDLCAGCEARRCAHGGLVNTDLFPMLKIDRPEQAPGTFVYIFNKRTVHGCHGGRGHGHPGRHGHGGRHAGDSVAVAVHRHVNCDHCGTHPIVGPRFKCAVRPDFDLCSTCAATVPQPYPMVKIYHPQHRPSTIVYAAALPATAATVDAAEVQTSQQPDVHQGVRCDECKVCPIVGARYQCIGRNDYDLCADCEALKTHQPFPMVKITDHSQRPRDLVFEVRGAKPVATRALTHPSVQMGIRCDECHQSPIVGPRYKCAVRDDFDLCGACEAKRTQPYPMIKIYDPQHHTSKLVFAYHDRLATAPSADSAPAVPPVVPHVPTAPSAAPTLPRPSLRFVRDRTLPDGTAVQPGQTGLRKIWDVRNDGLHAWPAGSTLVFCGGDVLHSGAASSVEPQRLLQPGEEGQLAVALTAVPEQDGRYVSYFRMQTADGLNFGQRLWADIVVTKPVAAAPAPASAPSSVQPSPFIQGMDAHMKECASSQNREGSPFIQGMDEHVKELQRLEGLARQAQEQEDRRLAEELDMLQLQDVHGAVDEEEEEQLLQQVMAEHHQQQQQQHSDAPATTEVMPSALGASNVVEEPTAAEAPLQVSVDAVPVDCVPALAELSPVPSEKEDKELELAEGWAVLVATAGNDKGEGCEYLLEEVEEDVDDCGSEYSAGVHQPASTSNSALLAASSSTRSVTQSSSSMIMTASYANACADLDLEVDDDSHHDHQHSQSGHEQGHQQEYTEDFEVHSSAAVESKEPEPEAITPVAPVSAPTDSTVGAVYHKELQMLAEMGFTDESVLVPLLQKHLGTPVAVQEGGSSSGGVDAQGLHAVLAELLN